MNEQTQKHIEAFKSFPSEKSFSLAEVNTKLQELGWTGPDRALEMGQALVTETAQRPMDGRQLFPGHKVGRFRWLDLSNEEIAEMQRLDRMPR